jgi:hypothetical protein
VDQTSPDRRLSRLPALYVISAELASYLARRWGPFAGVAYLATQTALICSQRRLIKQSKNIQAGRGGAHAKRGFLRVVGLRLLTKVDLCGCRNIQTGGPKTDKNLWSGANRERPVGNRGVGNRSTRLTD